MIRDIMNSVGGRGLVFTIFAFWLTACFVFFGEFTWSQWLEYNKPIALAFLATKAIEGGASSLSKLKSGGDGQ